MQVRLLSALALVILVSPTAAFEDEPYGQGLVSTMWSDVVSQSIVTPKPTWCVAEKAVDDSTMQAALDYACGQTTADCNSIKLGGPCFFPNTIAHHASFVFNSYYQMNAKGANTCSFGGAGIVTTEDPSNGTCQFPSSGSLSESTRVIENDGAKSAPHNLPILVAALCLLLMQAVGGRLLGW